MSIYEIALEGDQFNLEQYKTKFLLIVNIADECGLSGQLANLEALHQNRRLNCQVLAFPSNQFKQQRRDFNTMQSWCSIDQRLSFPIYHTISVNGKNTHPLFKYLKSHAKGLFHQERLFWNYTKFLVLPEERTIKRFAPVSKISRIASYIARVKV